MKRVRGRTQAITCVLLCVSSPFFTACFLTESEVDDARSARTPVIESKADLLAHVDGICREARSELEGAAQPTTLGESESYLRRFIEVGERVLREVDSLQPPPSWKSSLGPWTDEVRETMALAKRMLAAAEERQAPRFDRLSTALKKQEGQARAAAQTSGLEVCSAPDPGAS